MGVTGVGPEAAAAAEDPAAARAQAHARAYELIEAGQIAPALIDLETPLAEATANGWTEVGLLLRYAEVARATRNGDEWANPADSLVEQVSRDQDPALWALALAYRAETAARSVDRPPSEELEDDLARAVAVLDDCGSGADLPIAYIACAIAYHLRGLWELEEELYQRAAALLQVALPAPLDRTQPSSRRAIFYNRREAHVAWACALYEVGDRESAAEISQRGLALPGQVPGLPVEWAVEVAAMHYLLAAIAAIPPPMSFEQISAELDESSFRGAWACLMLAEAIRAHDDGDSSAAADLAERAGPGFSGSLPSAELLALHLAAQRPPVHEAALRYGRLQARRRWQERLGLLGSTRARIGGARMALDHQRLTERAYVDQLTGLANRHAYSRQLERLRQSEPDHRLAVLIVDLDHFKAVNDRYGHSVGDHVLRVLSEILSGVVRAGDLVARWGGDEFIVLLDAIDLDGAVHRARRLLRRVDGHSWHDQAPGLSASVSIGVAAGLAYDVDRLVEVADWNLVGLKQSGRGTFSIGRTAAPFA